MGLKIEQIRYSPSGEADNQKKEIEILPVTEEAFRKCIAEINKTYKIIRDSRTGRHFEIAIVNESNLKHGAILMPSTMFSSLTQNVGNAVEFAAHGAAMPGIARVYVAFPGNGGSDDLSKQDRRYLAQTGRFTKKNGQALDSISALAGALDDNDIPIKSISANVEGGRLGLGIMAALPANSVTSVYFNGLPGISSLANETFNGAMIKEDHRDQPGRNDKNFTSGMIEGDYKGQRERNHEIEDEEYRVSDQRCKEAKASLPAIYQGATYGSRLLGTYLRAFPNMRAYTKAFGIHDNLQLLDEHATFQDTLAALKKQEKAKITFQFSEFSMLHNRDECEKFGKKLVEALSQTRYRGSIQLCIYEGSLDWHTIFPSRRWAIEKDTLTI